MKRSFHSGRALLWLAAVLVLAQGSWAYSVLTHEQVVDLLWEDRLQPMLESAFPGFDRQTTPDTPIATKRKSKDWKRVQAELQQLKTAAVVTKANGGPTLQGSGNSGTLR